MKNVLAPLLCLIFATVPVAACRAESAVAPGGNAGKASVKSNVFIIMEKEGEGAELALGNILLPSAIGYFGWTSFSAPKGGQIELRADGTYRADILKDGVVSGDYRVRAYQVSLPGAKASGGKLYTVTFGAADIPGVAAGGASVQPAGFALMAAIRKSGKAGGKVRVVAAKFSKGTFTYKVAVK